MESSGPFTVSAIVGFGLAAPEPLAAVAFLDVALEVARVTASGDELVRRLGGVQLEIARGEAPEVLAADAVGFQHLAVVVSDIGAAYARVTAHGATAISHGGPVRLPPESGGVTAWKFRTPWGQPLELLETPTADWRARAHRSGELFLGVDHTALGCSDLPAALDAYGRRGFHQGPPSHNVGSEQDALDGLSAVDLHIRTLFTPGGGPHIELLNYASPRRPPARGTSAVTIVVAGRGDLLQREACVEGHRMVLRP